MDSLRLGDGSMSERVFSAIGVCIGIGELTGITTFGVGAGDISQSN